MTRVQQERFFNEDDYLRLRDTYILDEDKLSKAKPSMAVLHPLPRINEIAVEVDATRAPPTSSRSRTACSCVWHWKARWSETSCRDMSRSTQGGSGLMEVTSIQNGIIIDHVPPAPRSRCWST